MNSKNSLTPRVTRFNAEGLVDQHFEHWPKDLTVAETGLRGQFEAYAHLKSMLHLFFLQRGKLFIAARLPAEFPKRKAKQCYANALELASRYPQRYAYVEGYGQNFMATPHAWCVTRDGTVVDPTWDSPENCAYWGIPFNTDFLYDQLCEHNVGALFGEMPRPEVVLASVDEMVHPWWRAEIEARAEWPELKAFRTKLVLG
jgi:hypothetical protein